MKFEVSIFIETSYRGPAKREGVAMWLVEYKRGGEPITREGLLHLENGTENQAALMAIKAAVEILLKPCSIRVFTQCEHILNTVRGFWHIQWQKNDWNNAKGKPVKNSDLWKKMLDVLQKHYYSFSGGEHEYQNYMKEAIRKEMERCRSTKN